MNLSRRSLFKALAGVVAAPVIAKIVPPTGLEAWFRADGQFFGVDRAATQLLKQLHTPAVCAAAFSFEANPFELMLRRKP